MDTEKNTFFGNIFLKKKLIFPREFFIMYRKIFFISVNLLENIAIFGKATITLCFSFITFLMTYYARPFIFRKMNILEFYSNQSTVLTIFSGALYVADVNEWQKAICFMTVLIVNGFFALHWFSSLLDIIFDAHFETFEKYFPNLAIKTFALKQSLSRINFSLNLYLYFTSLKEVYSQILKNLKNDKDDTSKGTKMLIVQKIKVGGSLNIT
jgi:hypothetical protein